MKIEYEEKKIDEELHSLSTQKKIITSLVAGSIAGATAKTTIAPLDRAKINFQVREAKFSYKELLTFLRNDYARNGVLNLWRGNSATMVRVVPSAAINFTSHEQYKHLLGVDQKNSQPTPLKRFLAGSLAGLTAAATTYPLDLARARMAVTDKHQFANIVEIFAGIYRQEGLRGLYRGYLPTLLGALPYAGCGYFSYETLKLTHAKRKQRQPNAVERVLYGACAGAFAQTVSYPFDVVRRRFQTATVMNRTSDENFKIFLLLKKIFQKEGIIRGYYKGLSMNWIKGPIAAGVGFMTYDVTQLFIRKFYISKYHKD